MVGQDCPTYTGADQESGLVGDDGGNEGFDQGGGSCGVTGDADVGRIPYARQARPKMEAVMITSKSSITRRL